MKTSPSRKASSPRSAMVAWMGKPEVPLEHGQADALGDHLHVGVEDRAAEVQALADDVVVRGLDHGDPHALGRRVERGADHLDGRPDREAGADVSRWLSRSPDTHRSEASSWTKQPWSSTERRSPGSDAWWSCPDSSIGGRTRDHVAGPQPLARVDAVLEESPAQRGVDRARLEVRRRTGRARRSSVGSARPLQREDDGQTADSGAAPRTSGAA